MQRIVLIFLILTFINLPINAKIITGEIEYNAETVRQEVFSNSIPPANISAYRQHLIDLNNDENLTSLYHGITELKDRKIGKFSDGSYGVQYNDDPLYSWYYSSSGRLMNFTRKDSDGYPCKITKFKPDGTIINQGYRVSDKESFLFSPNGKLLAHWVGEICYDEYNNIIMTRKIFE